MAARCIPTRRGPIARFVIAARLMLIECDLICARHALATAEAYGDCEGYADEWRIRINRLTREIRALEQA